jgi:hypothetical protein
LLLVKKLIGKIGSDWNVVRILKIEKDQEYT